MLPYTYTHVNATTGNYDVRYQSVQTMLSNIAVASGGVTSALMSRVETVEQLEQVMQYVKKYNFPLVLRSGEYSREDTVLYKNAKAFDSFRVHIECLNNGADGLRDNLDEWKEIYDAGYGIIVTNDIYGLTEYIQEMEFQSIHVDKDKVPGQGEDTGTWD